MSKSAQSILDVILRGDRVTITNRFGQERGGHAVMRIPHGWVLDMGGAHGTPAIATATTSCALRHRKRGKTNAARASENRGHGSCGHCHIATFREVPSAPRNASLRA